MTDKDDFDTFNYEPLFPPEETRTLETVPTNTQQVRVFAQVNLPKLTNLEHVRRFRRTTAEQDDDNPKAFTLSYILCVTSEISLTELHRRIKIAELQDLIQPFTVSVSKYPPYTRAQFEAWKKLWPLVYRERPERDLTLATHEVQQFQKFIRLAQAQAQQAGHRGDVAVGAIVVDPKSSQILAQATDTRCSNRHPLQHAIMNAIEQVAVRECTRKSEPVDSPDVGQDVATNETTSYLCTGLDFYVTREPCVM
ncbi:tRNA-specific adenosine deaminase subunit tad3 [Dispira parvispora]|uniref:tRNA-specific adenosine deaminase subunit tad3 n=1 Tax=Dispira parvispora TaxID=1520584 RepID=A0A9W8ATU9_9FUNG|nr:tRNA-specific adenosine deaminase subunit tad3 [Dispira parvispora]